MKVSIVVPVYNPPKRLLADCLAALGRQTLLADEFEILLVDDASTDSGVANSLTTFAGAHPNCRVLRHETNRGINRARVTGVREARGEFVLFIDSDDIPTRDAAELLYLEAVRTGADIVTSPIYRWSAVTYSYELPPEHGQPFPEPLLERMKALFGGVHSFTMCGRLFRTSLLRGATLDMPDRLPHEDLAATVRALFAATRVSAIRAPVYYYTINDASISRVFTSRHIDGLFFALNDWIQQAASHEMSTALEGFIGQRAERLINTFALRCLRSTSMTPQEKIMVLRDINRHFDLLPVPRGEPQFAGTRLLARIASTGAADEAEALLLTNEPIPAEPWEASRRYEQTLVPTAIATRLMGKVVLIGQTDDQVRNAGRLAGALRQAGRPCAVLDGSEVADERPPWSLPTRGLFGGVERIQIREPTCGVDWLATASLVVTVNDRAPMFREALEYSDRLRLPTVGMPDRFEDASEFEKAVADVIDAHGPSLAAATRLFLERLGRPASSWPYPRAIG